jgi:hypothetical protein
LSSSRHSRPSSEPCSYEDLSGRQITLSSSLGTGCDQMLLTMAAMFLAFSRSSAARATREPSSSISLPDIASDHGTTVQHQHTHSDMKTPPVLASPRMLVSTCHHTTVMPCPVCKRRRCSFGLRPYIAALTSTRRRAARDPGPSLPAVAWASVVLAHDQSLRKPLRFPSCVQSPLFPPSRCACSIAV